MADRCAFVGDALEGEAFFSSILSSFALLHWPTERVKSKWLFAARKAELYASSVIAMDCRLRPKNDPMPVLDLVWIKSLCRSLDCFRDFLCSCDFCLSIAVFRCSIFLALGLSLFLEPLWLLKNPLSLFPTEDFCIGWACSYCIIGAPWRA